MMKDLLDTSALRAWILARGRTRWECGYVLIAGWLLVKFFLRGYLTHLSALTKLGTLSTRCLTKLQNK